MTRARLLAEAALAPLKNAFDDSGIGQKPKRRKTETEPEVEAETPIEAEAAPVEVEAAPQVAPEPVVEAVAPKKRSKKSAQAEA
jgi:hypothetical protein